MKIAVDKKKILIQEQYEKLMDLYGPRGWWPLFEHGQIKPTYRPGDYKNPVNPQKQWEIACGCILTQNTSWIQVEKAIANLRELEINSPVKVISTEYEILESSIRPAGYFRQKAKYLKNLAQFMLNHLDTTHETRADCNFKRSELLKVKGVGEETADSILLYAFHRPEFVIDAYTKRIFSSWGITQPRDSYKNYKELFEKSLDPNVILYQEYHALIVEHAKRHYSKKPFGINDPIHPASSRP